MSARAPGAFFRDHPGLYVLSLAGALGAASYATVKACKAEPGRARWWVLAGLTATQAVGMAASRRRARPPAAASDHDLDVDTLTGEHALDFYPVG